MSHGFKLKYDRMKEGNPAAASDPENPLASQAYETHGHVRNICFVTLTGYRIALNYAYLVGFDLDPEENFLNLFFTSHIVTLKGFHLKPLHDQLFHHDVKQITCIDPRYNLAYDNETPIVNEIIITPNN